MPYVTYEDGKMTRPFCVAARTVLLVCAAVVTLGGTPLEGWHLTDIGTPPSSGEGVMIAIVDSGVDPSFDAQRLDESAQAPISSHGSHMASLVAEVAPEADLVDVQVYTDQAPSEASVAEGIRAAVSADADIILVALAGEYAGASLRGAVTAAIDAGILVVAGAGNDGLNSPRMYPAALPNVLAVGAHRPDGSLSTVTSQWDGVDLTAPGVAVRVTGLDGNRSWATGTSPASAITAGAAATLLAAKPCLTPAELSDALVGAAVDGRLSLDVDLATLSCQPEAAPPQPAQSPATVYIRPMWLPQ